MTITAPDPLAGASGGGGGGGLTAESDEILLVDSGNSNTPFIRRFEKDDAGLITDFDDYQLDGTTAYVFTGPAIPASDVYSDSAPLIVRPSNAGPELVSDINRYTNADTPVAIAAGALRVSIIVIADGVTVGVGGNPAVTVDQGVSVDFGMDGMTTDSIDIGLDGTGVALVIEERDA